MTVRELSEEQKKAAQKMAQFLVDCASKDVTAAEAIRVAFENVMAHIVARDQDPAARMEEWIARLRSHVLELIPHHARLLAGRKLAARPHDA